MPSKIFVSLPIRLRGFIEPDTSSQVEGYLESGEYVVDEFRENYPNTDTDYAKVLSPVLGDGDTWICTRWKNDKYANVFEREIPARNTLSFDNDSMSIPESRLLNLLPTFNEFTYDLDRGRYPFSFRGYQVPVAPPATNNCCTFVEALIVKAWQDEYDDIQWSSRQHGQMMILSSDDYFSPVTALIEANMGLPVDDPGAAPHPWTVIQGWRKQWNSGHTFIIVDHHPATDKVLTLESNSSYKLDGVGFRMIGNLRDFESPPENWWELEGLWTWERIVSTYRFHQQACLKVRDRTWSRLS